MATLAAPTWRSPACTPWSSSDQSHQCPGHPQHSTGLQAAVEAIKSETPAARPHVAVLEVFEEQGISADEYERLNNLMKAPRTTPPEKWVDEGDRDVGLFCLSWKASW